MRLPHGVAHLARHKALIAKDADAVIRIDSGAAAANRHYVVKPRSFATGVEPYLRGAWGDFDARCEIERPDVAYCGAEFGYPVAGDESQAKLPNITVVPNWPTRKGRVTVVGCTMGHWHPDREPRVQEVYEFQGFGLLVLDHQQGAPEIHVARAGDKIAVPTACHMTLYNLGDIDNPLVTLDFADPRPGHNDSNKDLVGQWGPILLAYYDDFTATFELNPTYVANPGNPAGVRRQGRADEVNKVIVGRAGRAELGRQLYEQLTGSPDVIAAFAQLGLHIRKASPEVILPSVELPRPSLHVARPLIEGARPGRGLYSYFLGPAIQRDDPPVNESDLAAAMTRNAERKNRDIELGPLERPLKIVIEGAGDWVASAYRPAFIDLCGDRDDRLAVFYADDGRWKLRPPWTAQLKKWEVYLDKAEARAYEIYRNLRPDVVAIVTPDFTHSTIAQYWCGKCPLVFVEKPFDTQSEQVERLLAELGRDRRTAVLGLDHYQFYALPVYELRDQIGAHLGGALQSVKFFMTEDRPIELGRERTLQFGLTLDLLPHLLALLTYFGNVATVDDIRIPFAAQYRPMEAEARDVGANGKRMRDAVLFRSETAAAIDFTFEDHSGSGRLVPCRAVVGKGFDAEVKYCEFIGCSGRAIRVDFCRSRDADGAAGYPWSSLCFIDGTGPTAPSAEVTDAYDKGRRLSIAADLSRPIERDRYKRLFAELMDGPPAGGSVAVASTLSRDEARAIVGVLDRIWWAIHGRDGEPRAWQEYLVGQLDPMTI